MLRFTNILHGPDYFNITTLPEKYKKLAIEKLKNIQCIESFYINDIRGYSIYSLK